MRLLVQLGRALLRDSKGGTAIEYGLIVSLVVLAIMAALVELGSTTQGIWTNVSEKVQGTN